MASDAMVKAIDDATSTIESAIQKCSASAIAGLPALKRAVSLAAGIEAMKRALPDALVERIFMPLQGSPLGFVTDKDKEGGYPIDVVRNCMIEGMIKGASPINNEINIISGRCYLAKNALKRMVNDWPGLSGLTLTPQVPQMVGDKGALVSMRASWLLNGKPCELVRGINKETGEDTRIAVRVNSGMGVDAILGKAERKMFAAIYAMLTNGALTVDDGDVIDTVGMPAEVKPPVQDGKRVKLNKDVGDLPPEYDRGPDPDKY
jgi:hypothetical protein